MNSQHSILDFAMMFIDLSVTGSKCIYNKALPPLQHTFIQAFYSKEEYYSYIKDANPP